MRTIFMMMLVCLFQGMATAQNQLAQMKKTADYYNSLAGFSVDVSVGFYSQETSLKPTRSIKGFTRISGTQSHSDFDGKENIIGADFMLVADHNNKTVYYSPREKNGKANTSRGTEILDSAFVSRFKVILNSLDENFHIYRLTPRKSNDEFKSIVIKINKKTNVLTEVIYVFSGEVKYKKTIITYSNFNPSWKAGKGEFTGSRFIIGKQKLAKLTPDFSEYKLINSYNYDPKKNLIEQ